MLRMSSAGPPEFFIDRSLGKLTAAGLRDLGHAVHLIADFYPDDAKYVPDEQWIADGCQRGWVLLTKDKRIRYREHELAPLRGFLFCLANGQGTVADMVAGFSAAMPAILRAVARGDPGYWHIHADGTLRKMWP